MEHFLNSFNASLKGGFADYYFSFNSKISFNITNNQHFQNHEVIGYSNFKQKLKEINIHTFSFDKYVYYSQSGHDFNLVLLNGLLEINNVSYFFIATLMIRQYKIDHLIIQLMV